MPIRRWLPAVCFALNAVIAATAQAAGDAFYRVPLADLKLVEGEFPADDAEYRYDWRTWQRREAMQPRLELDGKGEAYIELEGNRPRWAAPALVRSEATIAVRAPQGGDVTGSLYVPKTDYTGMAKLRFTIPASQALKEGDAFYRAKEKHYDELLGRGLPGAAWFRHQKRAARRAQGDKEPAEDAERIGRARPSSVDDTFDLFSGGRAIRENLQLDRELRLPGKSDEMVEVDSMKGITIAEIDWEPLLAGAEPALDPLSRAIPADQHAVFFPSFAAMVAVADEISRQGTSLSRLALSRSEDERCKDRYERQLCLPLSTLARLVGPTVIESVALTGSDPYFFTGTDVAVIFEAKQPAALKAVLLAQVASAANKESGAKRVSGETEGLGWSGFHSPDRRVSCYIAELEGAVVATNSTAQLARLAQVKRGDSPNLATLDEYKFFRRRYAIGDADETALVFLSDAAIRRWCGPRWRIAASRRLRDAAVLSELQARFLDDLVNGKVEEGPIHSDLPLAGAGKLRLDSHGVRSSTEGTLEFQTPIAEMPLDRVTKAEADAYIRWRDTYQSRWRWAFDPIALRLTIKDERLAADLTVMPLIWGSDYRSLVEIARGADIKPGAGDPHESIAQFVLALNRKSQTMRSGANLAAGVLHVDPLSWLGDWISVYIDDDAEFWKGLAKENNTERAMQYATAHLDRLPLGVHIAVSDPLKLTAFLTGLRALAEQTAPSMTVWESLSYRDEPYVKLSASERARGELPPDVPPPHLFYSFSSEGLIVTLNEDVLKRTLDRLLERRQARREGKPQVEQARPWLGSAVCFQFDGKLIDVFDALGGEILRQTIQVRSWGNLPILNEWHRRYPDRDPVKLHEEFWHTRLVCAGGGEYVWNDHWQTMESTVCGHPGEPKAGPANPLPLRDVTAGNFGLTFEKQGLRARAILNRGGDEDKSP